MTLLGKFRSLRFRKALNCLAAQYRAVGEEDAIEAAQLSLFNAQWSQMARTVPFFEQLQKRGSVPEQFDSWEQFRQCMPVMDRRAVQADADLFSSRIKPAQWHRTTGGSTSQPIQIPAWNSEKMIAAYDMWTVRRWYGIDPDSRLFLLWGHSHLLGKGIKGLINGRKRSLFDFLLGYHRFSAYDLRPAAMERAAIQLRAHRPDYVVGYSVALDHFARANWGQKRQLQGLGVKVVIATAERFPNEETPALLSELFRCPVAMEYGAVETGVIAHSHPQGGYRSLWRSFYVEAIGDSESTKAIRSIRVTTLYPRCFPLVRYEIGDEVEVSSDWDRTKVGLVSFQRVVGRCNDYILAADGTTVHSEAFTHAVRSCKAVLHYQIVQNANSIEIHIVSLAELVTADVKEIRDRLGKICPALREIGIRRVPRLQQTIAGKTLMVIRE